MVRMVRICSGNSADGPLCGWVTYGLADTAAFTALTACTANSAGTMTPCWIWTVLPGSSLRTLFCLPYPLFISNRSEIGYWWHRPCERHRFRCPSQYNLQHDPACESLHFGTFHTVGTVNLECGGTSSQSQLTVACGPYLTLMMAF